MCWANSNLQLGPSQSVVHAARRATGNVAPKRWLNLNVLKKNLLIDCNSG